MVLAVTSPTPAGSWPDALVPLLLLLPLLSGLVLALAPRWPHVLVRAYALVGSLATLLLALLAAGHFDWGQTAEFQLQSSADWIPRFGLMFDFGVDAISMWLVLLATLLVPLAILGSLGSVRERAKEFYVWLLVLEAAMVGVFVARNLIFFYICFEFTLLPLYFLIGIFGSTQRLRAARVFFLYTFTGSMFTLAGLLYVAWDHAAHYGGVWDFAIARLTASSRAMPADAQAWVMLAMLAGFGVKVPLFPAHTWLPLAHTEAPTAGSVILAGVLLKLGTYALLRLTIPMTPLAVARYAPLIGVLAVAGILYTALICWIQTDLKKLIAYSSVSHLGFCVLGMFALNAEGMAGSVIYMVNHGLSTGALFLCVGMIYERLHSRLMSDMGGLARTMPICSFFLVFFCLASVGLPGLNGFVGEFLSLLGAFRSTELLGPRYAIVAGVGMILGAIYILHMVGRVVFGPPGHAASAHAVADLNLREVVTLIPLAAGCLWLGLQPAPLLRSVEAPLAHLREPAAVAVRGDSLPEPAGGGLPVAALAQGARTTAERAR